MNDEIREKVMQVATELCPHIDFETEDSLIDDGILESFDVIQIVTSLMEEFDIVIDADDIEPENLNSIDRMCALVASKLS